MPDHNLENGQPKSTGAAPNPQNGDWKCRICEDFAKPKAPEDERPSTCWRMVGGGDSETKLAQALESRKVHVIIVILTIASLTLILTNLCISSFYPEIKKAPEAVQTSVDVFAWTSVGILSLFALEQLAKLLVFGPQYFIFNFWHALDAFIIIVSLTLEIILHGAAREVTSLLIIFRLWRLVRIMHSIAEEVAIEHHGNTEKHHELEKKMQKRINELEQQVQLPPSPPMTINGSTKFETMSNISDMRNGSKAIQLNDPNDIV